MWYVPEASLVYMCGTYLRHHSMLQSWWMEIQTQRHSRHIYRRDQKAHSDTSESQKECLPVRGRGSRGPVSPQTSTTFDPNQYHTRPGPGQNHSRPRSHTEQNYLIVDMHREGGGGGGVRRLLLHVPLSHQSCGQPHTQSS